MPNRPANKPHPGSRVIRTSPEVLRRRVLRAVKPVGIETVPIERARGRVLAEVVRSPRPIPEMDRAVMDGYAVRHMDTRRASAKEPVVLMSVDHIGAGHRAKRPLRKGEAVRIMTGAPLPSGADAVVPIEKVQIEESRIWIEHPVAKWADVRRTGSEIRLGEVVLKPGEAIGPSRLAMLAFMDRPRAKVYRQPRVGVLSTGDELGPVGRKRPYGHIPDSNRYGLMGLVESAGCVPVDGGSVGDSPEKLLAGLRRLRAKVDFLITTGGVSAGDFDVVKVLFQRIGGVDLYRLRIKPGKPQAFGQVWGIPYFGLPGNPASAMVVFDFLVRPALRKLAGAAQMDMLGFRATAVQSFPKKTRDWEFPRAIASEISGHWVVKPTPTQKSSDLMSMVRGTGYVVLPPGSPAPEHGSDVLYIPFPG